MRPRTVIEDVFAAFGRASYYAQLTEYDVVSIWMLDSVTQGVSLDKQDLLRFQGDWGKKTFGRLLRPLRESNLIPEEIKEFLEKLRMTRNRLMHSFFLDNATDLQSNAGRGRVIAKLRQMTQVLMEGKQFFDEVLNIYLKDFGVDAKAIRRQVLQESEDSEKDG